MAKDKRDITTSPRIVELQRARKKRNRILFLVFFILFVGLIVGLSYLSKYQKITISKIVVEGTHIIDGSLVRKKAESNLAGNYIYLFAKKNTFIYPKSLIEKDLKKTFPRIENLSVKLEGVNTLKITIGERTGSYMYCGTGVPESVDDIGDNCYFINSDGYIFDKAPYFSGSIYFKFYVPLSNSENPLGQQVLEIEKFRQIISFVDGLGDLGFVPVSVVMTNEDSYSFHLKARPDGGEPEILFKKENDLPTIFNNLSSAMKNMDFKNQITAKYSTLLYIDLRFNNKVLYKFQ